MDFMNRKSENNTLPIEQKINKGLRTKMTRYDMIWLEQEKRSKIVIWIRILFYYFHWECDYVHTFTRTRAIETCWIFGMPVQFAHLTFVWIYDFILLIFLVDSAFLWLLNRFWSQLLQFRFRQSLHTNIAWSHPVFVSNRRLRWYDWTQVFIRFDWRLWFLFWRWRIHLCRFIVSNDFPVRHETKIGHIWWRLILFARFSLRWLYIVCVNLRISTLLFYDLHFGNVNTYQKRISESLRMQFWWAMMAFELAAQVM